MPFRKKKKREGYIDNDVVDREKDVGADLTWGPVTALPPDVKGENASPQREGEAVLRWWAEPRKRRRQRPAGAVKGKVFNDRG